MPGAPIIRTWPRRVVAAAGTLLLATACAPTGEPPSIDIRQEGQLSVDVVDSANDAGRNPAVAIDSEGRPAIAYLQLRARLRQGEIIPPVIPGEPQPPSVILATQEGGVWSRLSVTPQRSSPRQDDEADLLGTAYDIANASGESIEGVDLGLAVDAEGGHHVAWSTPGGIQYATDAGGNFGDPEPVVGTAAAGVGIAPDGQGNPWISYYIGNSVRVSHLTGSEWIHETVTAVGGPASQAARRTAIRMGPDGEPLIAFGDGGATMVAARSGDEWTTRTVTGPGGFAISLAVDGDGNPHLAYYDQSGAVRYAHSSGNGPWDVTELGNTQASGGPDESWGTGVAVDEGGNPYVTWSDPGNGGRVFLSSGQGSEMEMGPVVGSIGGTRPSIGVSGDGRFLALAWYDATNRNLSVATPAGGQLRIAHPPTPGETPEEPTTEPTVPPECQPDGTELEITAPQGAIASGFDTTCLAVEAATQFTLTFDNQDSNVPHNWALFQDQSATERIGGATSPTDFINGPDSVSYDVDPLEPGSYFYYCDLHPQAMTGNLFVPEGGDQGQGG